MTLDDIKRELKQRGWTYGDLADKLDVSESLLKKVFSEKAPLTGQLARHISLLFESSRTVVFVYSVDLPDETCREWIPGWDELSQKQQKQAVRAIVMQTIKRLKQVGMDCLTDEERRAMADCCAMPEIESQVWEAAEADEYPQE